jgi:hypothetical protein
LGIVGFENLNFFASSILKKQIKKRILLHSHENQSKFLEYDGWVEILMITLVSSQKSPTPNISAPSVHQIEIFTTSIFYLKPKEDNQNDMTFCYFSCLGRYCFRPKQLLTLALLVLSIL